MILGNKFKNHSMVQYGVWPNCCNNCGFCLREERRPYSIEEQLLWLDSIKKKYYADRLGKSIFFWYFFTWR